MKVLVIRFSSIGDIVLTSPVLRCLKQQVPGMEVHFLTKNSFGSLVEHSPYVDRVHLLGDDLGHVLRTLKREKFDLVVDLHHNTRTLRVKMALGAPSKSFPKLNREKWLLVNFKKDKLPPIHIVDRYLGTVAHLGVKNDGQGLDLFIPPDQEVDLGSLPVSHRNGYIALCIGAGHFTKRLPPHKLVELAGKLKGPLVIIGGPEDQAVGRLICNSVGARAFDTTGKYDLMGSASMIRQATSVIAHDSGAMHVASAFRKNTVSVWGNTVPQFGMGPYIPQHPERAHISEVLGLSCRPCSKIGFDKCPRGHFRCMEKQDLDQIVAWAARESPPVS
ncbi:MAG: glycosyltransferase family 9 protein [Flavobacteriales bacterium]|jgi:ADP-heptose:LPS heptosyltransferase|nr:glycosyltransferase family 9 protein [Flavobacteriales bacterium]MBK6893172.1 glycosyltransferase family 9 protein [Flavobacteriales bacterium]MBK7249096.1 glycosyltransferase family 9 protein [Flavobacteriales bacterium]MBK7285670.1 glycosyltransferase family 9 protein [Flavobacteriales bacterium]MBK9058655.1 glycosyltransferase family 9 protein [Flavobacteriales bacterium]